MSAGTERFRLPSRLNADGFESVFAMGVLAVLLGGLAWLKQSRTDPGNLPHNPAVLLAAVPLALIGASLLLLVAKLTPSRLTVGADGLVIAWMGTRQRLPFASLARIERYGRPGWLSPRDGLRLKTSTGIVVDLPIQADRFEPFSRDLTEVESAIRSAFEAFQARAPRDEVLLSRGSRDSRRWAKELRQLCAPGRADLRVAPVEPDALWRVLENPAQSAETRAAAAVALGPLDIEAKTRVRVAASATMDRGLRRALDRIAEAEEEELAIEALDQVSLPHRSVNFLPRSG